MKDKYTIINEMVLNTAHVMESKADEKEIIAQQYEEDGNEIKAQLWREDIERIKDAVELIRKYAGCWA